MELPKIPDVEFYPNFLSPEEHEYYFKSLMTLNFKPEVFKFDDKVVESKRKYSFHGNKPYNYSNIAHTPDKLTNEMNRLLKHIESATNFSFNSVLCNFYENGEASMGWHADKESELGLNPVIASVSFGATRKFAFRYKKGLVAGINRRVVEYELKSGDLLMMKGETQKYFEHSLVKDSKVTEPRINLTFRKVY